MKSSSQSFSQGQKLWVWFKVFGLWENDFKYENQMCGGSESKCSHKAWELLLPYYYAP